MLCGEATAGFYWNIGREAGRGNITPIFGLVVAAPHNVRDPHSG